MPKNQYYSASELAEKLNLPRTTINDWLKLYSGYLESELRGKRRIYSDGALDILRRVSEWRSSGKTSYEIGELLAEKYGIRPEIDLVAAPEDENLKDPTSTLATVPKNRIARREQTLEQVIKEFRELTLERERAASRRRFWNWLLILLIIGGVGAGIWYGAQFMSDKFTEQEARLKDHALSQQNFASEINEAIDRSSGDYQNKVNTLQSEINSLNQALHSGIGELKKSVEEREKSEIAELKMKIEALELQLKELELAKSQSELLLKLEQMKNSAPPSVEVELPVEESPALEADTP